MTTITKNTMLIPNVPTATWEGTLTTMGGELTVGGAAGAQLAQLYRTDPSTVYERVSFHKPDGSPMEQNPLQATDEDKLKIYASVSEIDPSEYIGQTFTLKIKVVGGDSQLHELAHGYILEQA